MQHVAKKEINKYKASLRNETLLMAINFYILATLLHESSHIYQVFGLDENNEINRFYKELYRKLDEIHLKERIILLFKRIYFTHERQATIDAFRIAANIYGDSSFHDLVECYHLCHLYYLKKNISALELTMNLFKMEHSYDFSSLSPIELLELGYPVSKEYLNYVHMTLDKYCNQQIEYKDAIYALKKSGRIFQEKGGILCQK